MHELGEVRIVLKAAHSFRCASRESATLTRPVEAVVAHDVYCLLFVCYGNGAERTCRRPEKNVLCD